MQRTRPVWGLVSLILIVALAMSNLWLWGQLNRPQPVTEPGVMRSVALTGTEAATDATGLLVISTDGEHGTLVVEGLPDLGSEHQYQLWLIHDGQRTNGGVFSVDEEGYSSLTISSPQPLSSYSAVGITIEPTGGSPGPTGDRVLGSTL
jgi:anti-sigma-K factor RskA